MVRLPDSGKPRPLSRPSGEPTVKPEIADDEAAPLAKRSKIVRPPPPPPFCQRDVMVDEPSPLGLKLRKSPSLVDLIQMRLSQTDSSAASCSSSVGSLEGRKKRELKPTVASGAAEKLKASNFPLSLLRIGSWERVSKHEGDLVAKCYFAKHKLVWEILEGGLKSKIEIQWPDIVALKATCPDNEYGSLHIVLARPPLFFRETDPQPRKHTLWQPTQDFTGGQANLHRSHFLQCSHGFLSKNFEKIIQCDPRLNSLSKRPGIILDLPLHFEPPRSGVEDPDDSKCQVVDTGKGDYESIFSIFSKSSSAAVRPDSDERTPDVALRNTTYSPCSRKCFEKIIQCDPRLNSLSKRPGIILDLPLHFEPPRSGVEDPDDSKCQVVDAGKGLWVRTMEENACKKEGEKNKNWGSTSMSDLVNCLGQHTSENIVSSNPSSTGSLWNKKISEDLTQYLLNDSQFCVTSDEHSPLFTVNTLHCLLQEDAGTSTTQYPFLNDSDEWQPVEAGSENELVDEKPIMSRKGSFEELLLLPRIASMPQFLFDIAEDAKN